MAVERINITSPVGRFVAGSLYKPNTTDFDGKPLIYKTGANAGQPRVNYFIGLAIPKAGEQHWSQTEWGSKIWALGHQAFPQAAQRTDFAWKIEDGDSTIPNKKNRVPRDNEGWPGHWILKLSGGYAPKIYFQEGSAWIENLNLNAVKPGYYVQISFSVDDNGQQSNPGVYLNHQALAFRGYGTEINFGPNVEEMGFGGAPLPPGASPVPLASLTLTPSLPPAGAPYPPPPTPSYQAPAYAPPAYQPAPAPPVPVVPQPGFIQMPPPNPYVPVAPSLYPPSAAPPALTPVVNASPSNTRRMTAKAGTVSYQAYITAGWTDAQLIAEGYMIP